MEAVLCSKKRTDDYLWVINEVHVQTFDGMGNPVTLRYPRGPDSSMVEHLVQFQKGLGSSPGPVTFHAAITLRPSYLHGY